MARRFREKIRYHFENFMARGGKAVFLSLLILFICSFALIVLLKLGAGAIDALADGKSTIQKIGNSEFHWDILTQLIDPGTVVGASGLASRLVGLVATLFGVVIFSMLIAFITTQVETSIYNFRKGRSNVLEDGHTLILGWSDRVMDIVRELIIANESEKRACVVILGPEDKEVMDEVVLRQIQDSKSTRIITRSGDPASLTELKRVNAAAARSAIVLATCSENAERAEREESDTQTMKTIMALVACQDGQNSVPVVAELFSEKKREMLTYFESDNIISINSWDILGKLLVQTSLTSGLEMVYGELLSFDGCEIYFYETEWAGRTFGELVYHFEDGVPLAVYTTDKKVVSRPPLDRKMLPGEQILIMAQDDSTIKFKKDPVISVGDVPAVISRSEQKQRRILILGWHGIGSIITSEYSDYLQDGSVLDVMMRSPSEEVRNQVQTLAAEHNGLTISLKDGDPLSMESLAAADPYSYDNVIILSQDEEDRPAEKIDSETFMILLLLRKIGRDRQGGTGGTKIITQVLNSENRELITQTDVDDFIISNQMITMIFAQLSEQPEIKKLYDDLFQEEGSEIYVKPANLYFDSFPVQLNFAGLIKSAGLREEICLGIRKGALSRDPQQNFGVVLDPPKGRVFSIDKDDFLVVLAEDEL